jgi:predicted DNA-binding protein
MRKKVLHTRVSDEMYDQLSTKAKKRRVTISNLIRNIVEDSLDLSGEVFDLVDEKLRRRLHRENSILGYQPIALSKDTVCDFCGNDLKKGTSVNLAFLENSAKKLTVCDDCKKQQDAAE